MAYIATISSGHEDIVRYIRCMSPNSPQYIDVVWFKRDLRITDHKPLCMAQQSPYPVLLMYVFEPSIMSKPDFGSNHLAFVCESLHHLQDKLRAQKSHLRIFFGEVKDILDEISTHKTIHSLYSHCEVGNMHTYTRDKAIQKWCTIHNVQWHESSILEVQRPHQNRDHWAKNWEAAMQQPTHKLHNKPLKMGDIPRLKYDCDTFPSHVDIKKPPPSPDRQPNKRGNPIGLLDSFLHDRSPPYRTAMSSPLLAPRACSRMSPHLSYGTISIRSVVQHTRRFVQQNTLPNHHHQSIRSFLSRLHWRGHFMQKLEDQVDIEWRCLDPRTDSLRPSGRYPDRLHAWIHGQTGIPMIDACMRFLNHTGWINFRMRAMLVSFACYHLWLDWREIHPHLAQMFTDYEPGIHLCQLQMQAGTTGINTLRIYNPIKQGQTLDPQGTFTRKWVPEIQNRNNQQLHLPANSMGQLCLFHEQENYPQPIVDIQSQGKKAKDILYSIRKKDRKVILPIIQKHASRKRKKRT